MARPIINKEVSRIASQYPELAIRAVAECAEMALPVFENQFPGNERPRRAIELTNAWSRGEASDHDVATACVNLQPVIDDRMSINDGGSGVRRALSAARSAYEAASLVGVSGTDRFYDSGVVHWAIYALNGETRELTLNLHRTWLPKIVLGTNHYWKTIYGQRTGKLELKVPAVPYKQEWPLMLRHPDFQKGFTGGRQYADRELVFSLSEAWQSEYFTPEMFVAIDQALEGRAA